MSKYAVENLFGIEGLNIAWYGIIIGAGLLLGVTLACYRASRYGMKCDAVYDFILLALPAAILCARAYYIIFQWKNYVDNPIKIFAVWEGGLAIYGGVIGGFLTAVLFCRHSNIPLLRFLDLAVPSLTLGQAIGRWGNFINQEAFGNIVIAPERQFFPYAVFIEELGEWHQATFFYESAWNLCLLAIMLFVSRKTYRTGSLLCLYLVGYGLGRFWIEGLRTDSLYLIPGLRISQFLSLMLITVGIMLWSVKVKNSTERIYVLKNFENCK